MNKPYYVLLTGGRNNAGDFLIKHRAKQLLSHHREDRDLVDLDGYRKLSNDDLEVVNGAKAVLLTGGPALHKNMYPSIYRLRDNLDEISAPITAFGVGWHSLRGTWQETSEYPFSKDSLKLLERIKSDGLKVSVRDYHSQNVLLHNKFDDVVMTGCPALYTDSVNPSHDCLSEDMEIKKVAFSLGVSLKNSPLMYRQMQQVLCALTKAFGRDKVEVAFHHGLPSEDGKIPVGVTKRLNKVQLDFLDYLKKEEIGYIDLSGSSNNLISYYQNVDLHVGYRVHAHIFMSSINKPSALIAEDGRGIALEKVLGGIVLPAYSSVTKSKIIERLHRFGIPIDSYVPIRNIDDDLVNILNYELKEGVKFNQVPLNIGLHKSRMVDFIKSLP